MRDLEAALVTTCDELLAALAIWREARGEPYQVKLAVAAVIVNRTHDMDNRWPKTLHRVVLQPRQFKLFNTGPFPYDGSGADWLAFQDCKKAVAEALAGSDPTGGATHYHDVSIDTPASWVRFDHVKTIGRVKFFSG